MKIVDWKIIPLHENVDFNPLLNYETVFKMSENNCWVLTGNSFISAFKSVAKVF